MTRSQHVENPGDVPKPAGAHPEQHAAALRVLQKDLDELELRVEEIAAEAWLRHRSAGLECQGRLPIYDLERTGGTAPSPDQETPMPKSDPQPGNRLQLTKEQKAVDARVLRKELDELELRVEELEERIAPKLAANHNESPLTLD